MKNNDISNRSPGNNSVIVAGEETTKQNDQLSGSQPVKQGNEPLLLGDLVFQPIENPSPSFENYRFINGDLIIKDTGLIRIKPHAVTTGKIEYHTIRSDNIASSAITSRTIKDGGIQGEDIDENTDIAVDGLTAENLAIAEAIDLGTNMITDGVFMGDWNFGNGNIVTTGTISGSFSGSFVPSGDVDMGNNILTNIGNSGTDFDVFGGLTLANTLNITSGGASVSGNSQIDGTLTVTGLNGVIKASAGLLSGNTTTSDLPEGTNSYWTQTRFDTAFGGKTTTNLAEGNNLYFSDSRARASLSEAIAGISYDDSTGTLSLTAGYIIPTTTEETNWNTAYANRIDTWNYPFSYSGNAVSLNYNATNLKLTSNSLNTTQDIAATSSPTFAGLTVTGLSGVLKAADGVISGLATTSDLPEGTNAYWTEARFDTAFSAKTTTDLTEGTNLYFLDSRARQAISETITGIDYDNTTGLFSLATSYVIPTTAEETNWNAAYSWGNHASAGYFVKATDTLDNILAGTTNVHLTSTLKTNYDTAYSHSQATSNVHGLTFTAEGSGGGLDADLLDGHDTSYFAVASGSGSYIQNQFASAQTGQFWLSNQSRIDNELLINTADLGDYKLQLVGNMAIAGDIIPTVDNTYSLGSPMNMWRDVYIGPGSLYINGQKVLQEDLASDIVVTADNNQSLRIKTSGTGDIELNPSGSGQILLKSNLRLSGSKYIETSDGSAVLFDDGLSPNIDNAYSLGSALKRWADFYGVNANISALTVSSSFSSSGNIVISKQDSAVVFNSGDTLDTKFWAGVTDDNGNDDDDLFQIGDGVAPGINPFLTINTLGSVGIGTSNPQSLLHVLGNESLRIERNNAQAYLQLYNNGISPAAGTSLGAIYYLGQNSTGAIKSYASIHGIVSDSTADSEDSYLQFRTTRAGTLTEAMRIDHLGNIGVGTTAPEGRVHVSQATSNNSMGILFDSPGVDQQRIIFREGSNAYFSLYHDGNYSSPDNLLKIMTADGADGILDVTAVAIKQSGNVGIGTTNPGHLLHVQGTDPKIAVGSDTNNQGRMGWNTAGAYLDFSTRESATYYTNTMVLKSGNVGIGTTAPTTNLEIKGGSSGTVYNGQVYITGNETTGAADTGGGLAFYGHDGSSARNWGAIQINKENSTIGNVASYFRVSTRNASGLGERLRITSDGNVGIGTTNPGYKLNVSGGDLVVGNGTVNAIYSYTSAGAYLGTLTNHPAMFVVNNSEKMRINTSGNIGIGTTGPSAQLHTTGTVRFANFGAGTLSTDANGNLSVSSDERLKNIEGQFTRGLSALKGINPINYYWKANSGLDTENQYTGFSAQNVEQFIPEAIGADSKGYLTLSERPILATTVNALKELSLTSDNQQLQIAEISNEVTGLTDNQNRIVKQLTAQLADQSLTTEEKIHIIGQNLDDLESEVIETIKDQIASANGDIADISQRISTIEEQMAEIQLLNSEEGIGLIDTRLGNIEIALNVNGNAVSILGNLSIAGNVDILSGSLTAQEAQVLGVMKAKDIEAEESIKGQTLKLGNETRGTATLEGGDDSITIETTEASDDAQIFLTPVGQYGKLYYDKADIKDGESFKVKIEEPVDNDIEFNWLIIK